MRMIELASGAARVGIAPDLGGAITAFTWRERPVLRPTAESALAEGNVRLASCYPLVPWSNRIRDARLSFHGNEYALARNFGSHPHALHGVGWQRAWSVAQATPQRARLVLQHRAQGTGAAAWPWDFRATQTFELVDGDGERDRSSPAAVLCVTLTLENTAVEEFPFGLGWHPFFPKAAATTLRFGAQAVWENDATQLPLRQIELPPAWRFDAPRTLDAATFDNVFTGWHGAARLVGPAAGLVTTLSADRACRCLVVYAPPGADFIALEPVTHETDAFNRAARGARHTGCRVLPPGMAFSCTMRIAATVLG